MSIGKVVAAMLTLAAPAAAQEWNAAPPNVPEQTPAFPEQTRAPALTDEVALQQQTIVTGLEHPWALAELPDGSWLVTERPGRLRHVTLDGKVSAPIKGLPKVDARGQGGLLDVVLAPDYASSKRIYWSFAEPRGEGENATAVATGVLSDDMSELQDVAVIFQQQPAWKSELHFGSRLVFANDGTLFVTTGERSLPESRVHAQDVGTTLGKVIHINPDGSPAANNPDIPGGLPEIWSWGHRNLQAAALASDGTLWTIEHGPRGGDELNHIRPGRNYGWPIITYGDDYDGTPIGEGITAHEGMEQPVYYWDPVIAPSGATFYDGAMFPEWKGDLLIGGMQAQSITRLRLNGEKVAGESRLLEGIGRVRDVAVAQDGAIWLVLDQKDAPLMRISRQ